MKKPTKYLLFVLIHFICLFYSADRVTAHIILIHPCLHGSTDEGGVAGARSPQMQQSVTVSPYGNIGSTTLTCAPLHSTLCQYRLNTIQQRGELQHQQFGILSNKESEAKQTTNITSESLKQAGRQPAASSQQPSTASYNSTNLPVPANYSSIQQFQPSSSSIQ